MANEPLTTGEQRMCWHAARGQDTPLPPQEVTEILGKISRLTAERDELRVAIRDMGLCLHLQGWCTRCDGLRALGAGTAYNADGVWPD